MMRYRVINEDTWEGFDVEGASVAECQLKADVECQLRGWSVMVMRSEKVEAKALIPDGVWQEFPNGGRFRMDRGCIQVTLPKRGGEQ